MIYSCHRLCLFWGGCKAEECVLSPSTISYLSCELTFLQYINSWIVCCTLMEVDRAKYIPTSDSLSLTKKTCHTKQLGGFSIIFLGEVYKTFRVCPQAAKKRSLSPPLSGCSSSARWRYARMISSSAASSSTPAGDQQSENIWLLSNNPICSM